MNTLDLITRIRKSSDFDKKYLPNANLLIAFYLCPNNDLDIIEVQKILNDLVDTAYSFGAEDNY